MRTAERVLAILTLAGGLAWAAYILWFGSDAGLTPPALLVLVWGGLAAVALWVLWLALRWWATRRGRRDWRRLRYALGLPLAVLLLAGLTLGGITFRLRFLFSRPALMHFVRTARPDLLKTRFVPGTRVGLFHVREVEVLPGGSVRLITTDCMFDDCGVVYSAGVAPPIVGEDTYSSLGGDWWHWRRSW